MGRPPRTARRVRCGRPGSADGTSCAAAESARSLAPTPAGPFRPPSAAPHGDPNQERSRVFFVGWASAHRGAGHRWAEAHPIKTIKRCEASAASAAGMPRSALLRGPPRPRRGRGGKSPQGRAQVAREFAVRPGMACQRTSAAPSRRRRAGARRPRPRGCPSLWLLSLGQARESDSLAREGERSTQGCG